MTPLDERPVDPVGDPAARESIVVAARSLFDRRLTHGSTGNISVRTQAGVLVTATGTSLGTLTEDDLSLIDLAGRHLAGPRPSKEAFLHAALLSARPSATAVVHTHSTYSVAVSCLAGIDPENALPPLTAYFAMRVGRLPVLPYFAPGDLALCEAAKRGAVDHHALLLRNHGPIVAGPTMAAAMDALEEVEETAKLYLLLHGLRTQPLTLAQVDALTPASAPAAGPAAPTVASASGAESPVGAA